MRGTGRRLRAVGLTAALLGAAACGPAAAGVGSTPAPDADPSAVRVPTPGRASPTADPDPSGAPSPGPTSRPATARPGTALAALADLPVKGRAPRTGYDRALFGATWADLDGDGCDSRQDVLRRDLVDVTPDSGCPVVSGTASPEPYTGRVVAFRAGASTLDVDHVVALGNAWQTGAQQWDDARRQALANDPLELLLVDASANRQKGDGDAATWLPPAKAYRCAYVARQVAVKRAYGLWVTPPEHDALARVLATCPSQPLPVAGAAPVTAPVTAPTTAPRTAVPTARPAPAPTPGTTAYASCAQARAAGAAPLHAGDPGYSRRLDRDGDGVACE